jgi:hypothetical protein
MPRTVAPGRTVAQSVGMPKPTKRVTRSKKPRRLAADLPAEPVGVDERRLAVLQTIIERFDGRPLSWETIEKALSLVNFEAKQAFLARGRKRAEAG